MLFYAVGPRSIEMTELLVERGLSLTAVSEVSVLCKCTAVVSEPFYDRKAGLYYMVVSLHPMQVMKRRYCPKLSIY